METLKAALADLQGKYTQLTDRERRLVTIAGTALAGFFLFILIFSFSSSAA